MLSLSGSLSPGCTFSAVTVVVVKPSRAPPSSCGPVIVSVSLLFIKTSCSGRSNQNPELPEQKIHPDLEGSGNFQRNQEHSSVDSWSWRVSLCFVNKAL